MKSKTSKMKNTNLRVLETPVKVETVATVVAAFEDFAPRELAEDWDRVGLQVGDENMEVRKILVALDTTEAVIKEAIKMGVDMIVTHHPLLFGKKPIDITTSSSVGRRVLMLAAAGIALYVMHTNLDIAYGGTSDVLADMIGLMSSRTPIIPSGAIYNKAGASGEVEIPLGLGRIGRLPEPMKFDEFVEHVKGKLHAPFVQYSFSSSQKEVRKIAICTGSGADAALIQAVADASCDVYITGDVKYHMAQMAEEQGVALIDATHYFSEVIVVPVVGKYIKKVMPHLVVTLSQVDGSMMYIR